MCRFFTKIVAILLLVIMAPSVAAYSRKVDIFRPVRQKQEPVKSDTMVILPWFDEELAEDVCLLDSANIEPDTVIIDPIRPVRVMPTGAFRELVFDSWQFMDTTSIERTQRAPETGGAFDWIDDMNVGYAILNRANRDYVINNPDGLKWIASTLPERPENLDERAAAIKTKLAIKEAEIENTEAISEIAEVEPIDWIQNFNAALQFSQAYVSPNWYQGGNRSLLVLMNLNYNLKLNQKRHPNLLFETNVSYKLGINSSPEDTVRSYNMSEDLFQINSTFGYKAFKRWYYSANLQFKTQMLRSYKSNTDNVKSAFLSPGELNIGVGMTYKYTNKRNTFTCNASVAPLSWQLRTCIDNAIDETAYDIKPGRNMVSKVGSSAEYDMTWKITYNIKYVSRLFLFTDYSLFQGDWEHTLSFSVNKYISTQIYAHMRYDTSTPRATDSWHKFQFKELFSLGFTYSFSNT